MTTIPSRKKRLEDNINSILNQSWQGFEKYCINIDDNLSKEDYEFYDNLKQLDNRIEINICEHKWRSCNKLLPTITKYPEDVVITVDDDTNYPIDSLKTLVEEYEKNPDCIITHEVNPIIVRNGKFEMYVDCLDIKMKQKEFGKYLSNCCLFPPHVFDNSDVFDYEKMIECTDGTHDELWFWVNSTINGVHCIGLNYVYWFIDDVFKDAFSDGYKLSTINGDAKTSSKYIAKIKEIYGERLNKIVGNEKIKFYVNNDNLYLLIYHWSLFKTFYAGNCILNLSSLTTAYKKLFTDFVNTH